MVRWKKTGSENVPGNYEHSIGHVITCFDYEMMSRGIMERQNNESLDSEGPTSAEEKPLGLLRESNHG